MSEGDTPSDSCPAGSRRGESNVSEFGKISSLLEGGCGGGVVYRREFILTCHLPGVENTRADRLSRSIVDGHDWQLKPQVFQDAMGTHRGGSLCFEDNLLGEEMFQLETRPSGRGN